ncbi:YjbH domain-containing protein [Gammaproteobacteria bacterium]|nr:YjbH domain-containing protein [Gammaproteobacteria bacterium]
MSKFYTILLALFSLNSQSAYYIRDSLQPNPASYNSVSQTGLIHLPSAQSQEVGTVGFTVGNSTLNKFLSISATPFSWLETSFYYHRPRDSRNIKKGNYLDKGFNVKFSYSINNLHLALGLDDIAGTGYFSKEYLAATYEYNDLKFTLGMGTGAFSQEHSYKNPIKGWENRSSLFQSTGSYGGEIDLKAAFKGPVGIFGGLEYRSRFIEGLTVKIESNPFVYGPDPNKFTSFLGGGDQTPKSITREKEKNYNIGFHYQLKNNYALSLSQTKGNNYDLKLSKKFAFNAKRLPVKPKKVKNYSNDQNLRMAFYENLLRNLEQDSLFLQSASLNGEHLELGLVNNKYNNPIDVFKHAKNVSTAAAKISSLSVTRLTVTNIQSGIETGQMEASNKNLLKSQIIGKAYYTEPKNITDDHEFQTSLNFPELYWNIKPNFIYRYADPQRFFAGGWDLQAIGEIKFSPNLYLTTAASYQVTNSFDRLIDKPASPYLQHVRTDYVQYVQRRPDLYLNTMQLDYFNKVANNHYIKFTAGMFEMMFGGYGVEYYWKPFNKNLSIGLNLFEVKQRSFEQLFDFRDYKTKTGHTNFIYFHEKSGVLLDLSFGKYLAGDQGYTFDFSRKFKSGLRMGAYFTRTNISKEVFGEGSFDKAFYFEVPLSYIFKNGGSNYANLLVQPLSRDGGVKLRTANPLFYSIFGGTASDYRFYKN